MSEAQASEASPFTPLTAALMVLIGVFAFCALLVLATYASRLESGDNGGGHALSRSAIGFAGLAKALKDLGEPVLISRHRLPPGRFAGILIETPPPTAPATLITRPDETTNGYQGPILVVLPKWLASPDPRHRGWVTRGFPLAVVRIPAKNSLLARVGVTLHPRVNRLVLTAAGDPFAAGERLALGPVDSVQSINLAGLKGWTAVLTDERGAVLLAAAPDSSVFLLSDPDLLDNQGLKSLPTFAAAVRIVGALRLQKGPVMFDVMLNGLGQERSALSLLFDPPFLAVTLCLAAAAALAGVQAFCRFGPVRAGGRAIALGKEALADNTAALVRLAGREPRMAGRYADLTADLAARAVGAPRSLSGEALVAFLDRLGARRGAEDSLSELTLLARTAPDTTRLMSVAARLHHWRTEMTGET